MHLVICKTWDGEIGKGKEKGIMRRWREIDVEVR